MKSNRPNFFFATDYQLHKNLSLVEVNKNIIDFTEKKLEKMIKAARHTLDRDRLETFLTDYKKGLIAISWSHGQPKHVRVTKDK
jgi:hypothetical protein